MTPNFFSDRFKHKVCQEYLQSNRTKSCIQDKYGIRGKSALLIWLRKFGYVKHSLKPIKHPVKKSVLSNKDEEVKQLKASLKEAELKAEAYRRMISIAEHEHKIDIIKKDDTK